METREGARGDSGGHGQDEWWIELYQENGSISKTTYVRLMNTFTSHILNLPTLELFFPSLSIETPCMLLCNILY
jgi:hypothetical protein